MPDQADGLRQWVQARSGSTGLADPPPRPAQPEPPRPKTKARSLLFTSGKGGVGTSNVALNLAIALGELGRRVLLVDADLGLANIDLLCGLAPRCDLGDVLVGDCPLESAIVDGPAGIKIVPGAHGMRTLVEVLADGPARLAAGLAALEAESDHVIIDAGSGLGSAIATLAAAADEVVVVTTPEPTSTADAHAAIGRFRRLPHPPMLRILVNQARTDVEGSELLSRITATSREFLGMVVEPLGYIRHDLGVPDAVRARRPYLIEAPNGLASRSTRRLAGILTDERGSRARRPGFFTTLRARWALEQVGR